VGEEKERDTFPVPIQEMGAKTPRRYIYIYIILGYFFSTGFLPSICNFVVSTLMINLD
jgi:hypothetical protein